MAGLALLLSQTNLLAQINLNWATSFSPSWGNGDLTGTASNIGGNSINCSASFIMTGAGVFMPVLGSSGSQSPSVSGAVFTVPGTTNRIQVTPNYNSNSSYTDIVLSFSSMTTNISFRIVDIDKSDASSTTYFDRVTVTGSNGSSTFNPTLTKYDPVTDPNFLVLSGNSAQVNTTSGQAGNTASMPLTSGELLRWILAHPSSTVLPSAMITPRAPIPTRHLNPSPSALFPLCKALCL
jgi:hypothetical protein